MAFRTRTKPSPAAPEPVDLVAVRDMALSTAQSFIERLPAFDRTDMNAAWRLVDWVTADGSDHAIRFRALIAVRREVRAAEKPTATWDFLERCAEMERFLLGNRPRTPDRTAPGR